MFFNESTLRTDANRCQGNTEDVPSLVRVGKVCPPTLVRARIVARIDMAQIGFIERKNPRQPALMVTASSIRNDVRY